MAFSKKSEDLRKKLAEKKEAKEKKSGSLKTVSEAVRKLNSEISAIERELKYAELDEICELMLESYLSFDDVKNAIKSGVIKGKADVFSSVKQEKISDTAEEEE